MEQKVISTNNHEEFNRLITKRIRGGYRLVPESTRISTSVTSCSNFGSEKAVHNNIYFTVMEKSN